MTKRYILPVILPLFLFFHLTASSHCQVPCGIYEDSLRINYIAEHITTIEKAMNKITELEKEAKPNYNQIVRWVNTKELHAAKIQETVDQYFLIQRIKPVAADEDGYERYITHLTLLHRISVYAMKAKQTTDLENVKKLRKTLDAFSHAYFHTHGDGHHH